MRLLAIVAILITGCSDSTDPTTDQDAAATSERFRGDWMIDQPFHALYEVSWYRFEADGALVHRGDCSIGEEVPTGWVSSADGTQRCTFGERWSSADDETLVIEATCLDGDTRDTALGFPADAAGNAQGLTTVEVLSVGDETDWAHGFPEWRWVKCVPGGDGCVPQLDSCSAPSSG